MWYTSYVNDAGIAVAGREFDSLAKAIAWASKRPTVTIAISNTEPDLLGRAYSEDTHFNQ